jgi:hypothetical protein
MEKTKVDYSRVSKKVEKAFFYIKKIPYHSKCLTIYNISDIKKGVFRVFYSGVL